MNKLVDLPKSFSRSSSVNIYYRPRKGLRRLLHSADAGGAALLK